MKKPYTCLLTLPIPVEREDGFLACSVKVDTDVEVEQFHNFFIDDKGVSQDFSVKFED